MEGEGWRYSGGARGWIKWRGIGWGMLGVKGRYCGGVEGRYSGGVEDGV